MSLTQRTQGHKRPRESKLKGPKGPRRTPEGTKDPDWRIPRGPRTNKQNYCRLMGLPRYRPGNHQLSYHSSIEMRREDKNEIKMKY